MQILINIPDEAKEKIDTNINECDLDIYDCVLIAVKNGIVLPEEHGRLIDADELYTEYLTTTQSGFRFSRLIDEAQTIIPRGKENE